MSVSALDSNSFFWLPYKWWGPGLWGVLTWSTWGGASSGEIKCPTLSYSRDNKIVLVQWRPCTPVPLRNVGNHLNLPNSNLPFLVSGVSFFWTHSLCLKKILESTDNSKIRQTTRKTSIIWAQLLHMANLTEVCSERPSWNHQFVPSYTKIKTVPIPLSSNHQDQIIFQAFQQFFLVQIPYIQKCVCCVKQQGSSIPLYASNFIICNWDLDNDHNGIF